MLLRELLNGGTIRRRRPGETVEPRPAESLVPASAEQKHVWLHAAMAPDLPLYNESITIHRRGSFSLEALEKALNAILRRHEMWRTSFVMESGRLRALVHPDMRLVLHLTDMTHLPEAQRDGEAVRMASEDARQPLALDQAPLLRAKVVRLAEDDHRLYLTLHHIIFDGVSIYRLIVPELAALYAAYVSGAEPDLPPPRLQYADYAIWREGQLAANTLAHELGYWRQKLSGELVTLRLPTDRAPPPVPSYRGSMETFQLSPALTEAVKEFSRREGVTLYTTLLAAFKAMLHRYSWQEDIVIGGVTDTRRRPELESVVGYFLNSVALRTRPSGARTFRDYLREVQATVVEALDASNIPFDQVVRDVGVKRDGGRHPLFQVLFSMEPPAPEFPDGWALTQMDVTVGTAKYDLYLELDQEHDRLIGRFLYSTDLFDAATIRRMIGHWQTLLDGATHDPGCVLGKLPLLTAEERQEILIRRNDTVADRPHVPLHGWFGAQLCRTPDAVAVECDGQRWRYGELDRRATTLAGHLHAAGVVRGTLVAIAMERSPDMVAGLLAILRLGAIYLPLDPGLPTARLALLIEDARPAIILADAAAADKLPPSDVRVLLCPGPSEAAPVPDRPSPDAGTEDDLAYVLYTSGSTGRPKAVEIRHDSVVNLLAAMQRELAFDARDRFLAVTTLSFDIAALEIFLPLVSGGTLIIASRADATDPVRLSSLIARCRPTVMQATPATWRGLLACGWPGDKGLKLLCGGEALPRDLARPLLARGAELWNMYGPTETTIWSLAHRVTDADDPVPIGRPLANTHVYILDRANAPVPDLVPGELMLGGQGLARSYRGDPDLTAEKFITVASLGGERLYRTGDMARYRGDGKIEFLGRTDNQVKIRGFRVGIEEVEAAVARCPSIAACAVAAIPDASGELSLTAYLVGAGAIDIPGLRSVLRQTLPAYMVPTSYMVLPALPMTSNGKVDRKRLPLPPKAASLEADAPRDALERRLVELWKEVLGLAKIGIHQDFFDLGGHSLLASFLIARIKEAIGRELPLVALFRARTVAGIATMLRADDSPPFSHLVPLRPRDTGRPLFIIHGIFGNVLQLRELAERLHSARPIYAIQACGVDPRYEPHGSIAAMVDAYEAAIRAVQPAGPYALGGYSFGGLVAYELACRFRARGDAVELLALFETDLYARYLPLRDKLAYGFLLAGRVVAKVRALPLEAVAPYLLSKVSQLGHRLLLRLGLRDDFVLLDALNGPMADRQRRMYRIGVRAFVAFKPKAYDGKLSVFRIKGRRFDACDPMPIWRRVAKSVEFFEIDGEHGTIMEKPYVDILAVQLDRCLARIESPATDSQGSGDQPVNVLAA